MDSYVIAVVFLVLSSMLIALGKEMSAAAGEIEVYEGKNNGKRSSRNKKARLLFSGRCDAPMWVMVQSLETAITVRKPVNFYPLNRYWLDLGEADYQRGSVAAKLQFVEELKPERVLFFKTGKNKAVFKNYGFIWAIEEVLLPNKVELVVELFWKDLSPGKDSRFEEDVVFHISKMTREIVQNLHSNAKQQLLSPPPPISNAAPIVAQIGPPPVSSVIKGSRPRLQSQSRQSSQKSFSHMSRGRQSRPTNAEQTRKLIEWPSPQDYQESIQNPQQCFSQERLCSGEVESDVMGMPRVSSGAFASVYRLHCAEGDKAVRCFLHPIKDQEFRYKVLSDSIKPQYLPWTVNFEYVSEGIRVGNKWYPILVMDWVEGTPLNIYVEKLCYERNTAELKNLRSKFNEMINGLRIAAVAHGDLQHGNILVRDGRLVLVDYDGMYVPGLKQQISNELGHPNYQHPRRSDSDFSEITDHFSAWIIDSALLCLSEDPTLWRYCFDDGECMLFHRHDFVQPDKSQLLAHLFDHASSVVRERAQALTYFLKLPSLDEIPPLNIRHNPILASANTRMPKIVLPEPQERQVMETAEQKEQSKNNLPDWLDDFSD